MAESPKRPPRDAASAPEGSFGLVTVAVLLLVGSVGGAVWLTGDFRDPRLLWQEGWLPLVTSGWAQLVFDFLLAVLLLAATLRLRGVSLRRVQVGVLVSLTLHFWLGWFLQTQEIRLARPQETDAAADLFPSEELRLPDYYWDRIESPERTQEDFDRPVEATPQSATEAAKVGPKKIEHELPLDKLAPVEPGKPQEKPELRTPERAELKPPQRDDVPLGPQISRAESEPRIEPGKPLPEPQIKQAQPLAENVRSQQTAADRRELSGPNEPKPGESPEMQDSRPEMQMPARRVANAMAWDRPLASTIERQPSAETRLDAPQVESPQIVGSSQPPREIELDSRPDRAERQQFVPQAIDRSFGSSSIEENPSAAGMAAVPERRVDPARSEQLAAAGNPALVARRSTSQSPAMEVEPIDESIPADSPSDSWSGAPVARAPSTAVARTSTAPSGIAGEPALGPLSKAGSGNDASPLSAAVGSSGRARWQPGERDIGTAGQGIGAGQGSLARSHTLPQLPGAAIVQEPGMPGSNGQGGGNAPGSGTSGSPAAEPRRIDVASLAGSSGPDQGLGGLDVRINAPAGAGGLSRVPSRSTGIPGRRALPDTGIVHDAGTRVTIAKSGGPPIIEGSTGEDPKSFFQQRSPQRRGETSRAFGGNEKTEEAVERGIDFLVRHQFPDGHWSLDRFPQGSAAGYENAAPGVMNADTAGTGLALLAMLGAGYTHTEGKHQAVVQRGIGWLLSNQQEDGQLFTSATDKTRYGQSYGHAIATIALCEAYAMTGDKRLREPAQRAIGYIVASQHRERGGWRYEPLRESDTSVSGWKLMALKSAQMAGLKVPPETLRGVSHWLDLAQFEGGSRYAYNPYASDSPQQREGREANLAMTSEGLLMRMYLGWDRTNPALLDGARWIASNLPETGTATDPRRDAYYWYYATQVMFQVHGPAWDIWNEKLQAVLLPSQVEQGPLAGSWEPMTPVPDRWGGAAGRHYVTTLHLLMLEVYYRHLPLYKELRK